eukprot:4630416-Pleurochrysis_carterae.AAC.1
MQTRNLERVYLTLPLKPTASDQDWASNLGEHATRGGFESVVEVTLDADEYIPGLLYRSKLLRKITCANEKYEAWNENSLQHLLRDIVSSGAENVEINLGKGSNESMQNTARELIAKSGATRGITVTGGGKHSMKPWKVV